MVQLRYVGLDRQRQGVLRAISAQRNRCVLVFAIFGGQCLVYGFVSHRQDASEASFLDNSILNGSIAAPETIFYRTCTDGSLELCRPIGETNSGVKDAGLRTCRSERELFTAAVNTTQGEKCLFFEDLGTLPQGEWSIIRIPEAYQAYPMDLDLRTVVLAYTYGLEMNVKPINNPSLSVVRASMSVCAAGRANSYTTMIIVKSALANSARRRQLREVIRRQAVTINATVGLLFSLGLPGNGQMPPGLLSEISQFDDILLANYVDTYLNLTLKTITNLRYVHHHCLHTSPSFVFLDDDHGINVTQPHQVFSRRAVVRNTGSKWFTGTADYPFPHYPDYPIGPCYIIGADLIPKLSIAAAFTRPLPNEDVYVGMMLMKLGVKIHPLSNMFVHMLGFTPSAVPLVGGLDVFVKALKI
nr:unnamed protein product [Spirometra erinaceieuropaei]